jgi:hypothetical protein
MFVIPRISEQEAANIFSEKKKFSLSNLKKKSLSVKRVELVYLPFYLFDIFVQLPRKQKVTLSVDGLLGHSVFFIKDDLDVERGTKNAVCSFGLSLDDAQKIVLGEYKAFLLEHGLRTRSAPQTEKISRGRKIFYPFWVGYFTRKGRYDFIASDAVSGEIQGVKMRKVFMRAFRLLK